MFYGKYKVPIIIKQLMELEEKVLKSENGMDSILFRMNHEEYNYSITPIDLISFANTGCNGGHFGFLTDFGQQASLESAPIVKVVPSNDPPIRIVANNIYEFLQLLISVPSADVLDYWWTFESEEEVARALEEEKKYYDRDYEKRKAKAREHLIETFQLQPVDYLSYTKQVKMNRKNSIKTTTIDGLGVLPIGNLEMNQSYAFKYPFSEEFLPGMKDYLKRANELEKHKFIRDALFYYIVTPDYDKGMYELLLELLEEMDLMDEYNRLKTKR